MRRRWRHDMGLTLIETMISLMVFSVGMLGLSGLTTVIIHDNSLSQKVTMATILAQDKLEAVQTSNFNTLANEREDIITDNHRHYTRVTSIADNTPRQGMRTVSIAVYWTTRDSTQRHVSLKTIVIDDR